MNSPLKKSNTDAYLTPQLNAKDRKYINLESQVVLGDNVKIRASEKPEYNPNLGKAAFGTQADWSTQAASTKLNNKFGKVDTYKKRQEQLSSKLFETPDEYKQYIPLNKKQ